MTHAAAAAGPDPRIHPFKGVTVTRSSGGKLRSRTVIRVQFSPFAQQSFVSYFTGQNREAQRKVTLSSWRQWAMDGVAS